MPQENTSIVSVTLCAYCFFATKTKNGQRKCGIRSSELTAKKIRGAARRCSVSIPMDDDLSLKAKRIAKVLRKKQIEGEGERDDDDDGEADD